MRICLFVLLLAGCATTEKYWDKPGASASDFEADKGQCQAQAFSTPGMYTMQVALVFNSCMRGKGWALVEAH
jgi:hypothetical protein